MKNKKILLINKSLVIGGIETVLMTQYYSLLEDGHDVDILLFKDMQKQDVENLNNIYVLEKKESLKSFVEKREKSRSYDLVVCHAQSEKICKIVKALNHDKSIFILHGMHSKKLLSGNIFARYLRKKRKQLLYKNQNIISVSDAVKEDILSIGVKPKKIVTIYNPFNIAKIKQLAKEETSFNISKKYIVWVGRISSVKNLPLAMEIYQKFSNEYDLIIVGDGDKKIIDRLKEMMTDFKLHNKLHFIGAVSNPYPYIKNASLMLLTSKEEGLPTVALEALILQTPVFGVDIPAINELLSLFFPEGLLPNNIENIKEHIEKNVMREIREKEIISTVSFDISNKKYLEYIN